MAEKSSTGTPSAAVATRGGGNRPDASGAGTPLQTERGNTTIADAVVTKVAGIAAREVRGVHDLGGGVSRALGSVTQRVGIGDELSQGVSVEVGEREAAVDLTVVDRLRGVDPAGLSSRARQRGQAHRGHHRPVGDRGQRDGQRPVLPGRRVSSSPRGWSSRADAARPARRPRRRAPLPLASLWRALRSKRRWRCRTSLPAKRASHGLRVTADPPAGLLRGVSVTAERDGRYAVDLRLVARMTPLMPLGDAVRRRVIASARRAQGLADQLGSINVEFARVLAPEEDRAGGGDAAARRRCGPSRRRRLSSDVPRGAARQQTGPTMRCVDDPAGARLGAAGQLRPAGRPRPRRSRAGHLLHQHRHDRPEPWRPGRAC